MSKRCMEEYEIERIIRALMQEIRHCSDGIETYQIRRKSAQKKVKEIALKGDCSSCEHRIECVTNNTEVLK
jgi:hypothetical protein